MGSSEVAKAVKTYPTIFNREPLLEIENHWNPEINGVWPFLTKETHANPLPAGKMGPGMRMQKYHFQRGAETGCEIIVFHEPVYDARQMLPGHVGPCVPHTWEYRLTVSLFQRGQPDERCGCGEIYPVAPVASTWYDVYEPLRIEYTQKERSRADALMQSMLNPGPPAVPELPGSPRRTAERRRIHLQTASHALQSLCQTVQERAEAKLRNIRLRVLWAEDRDAEL